MRAAAAFPESSLLLVSDWSSLAEEEEKKEEEEEDVEAPLIKLNIMLEPSEENNRNQASQGGKILIKVFGAGSTSQKLTADSTTARSKEGISKISKPRVCTVMGGIPTAGEAILGNSTKTCCDYYCQEHFHPFTDQYKAYSAVQQEEQLVTPESFAFELISNKKAKCRPSKPQPIKTWKGRPQFFRYMFGFRG
ncbi:hypothetical protein TURU_096523 [Turdus rufiventris]|nr:hypothetical protein TURU_096523 [Turdus rufiventris]